MDDSATELWVRIYILSPGIEWKERQINVQKLPYTLLESKIDNLVQKLGNIVSVKDAFVLKEHMILSHFYNWNDFILGREVVYICSEIISSVTWKPNLFNHRQWNLIMC